MNLNEQQAKALADWWTAQLHPERLDNGDALTEAFMEFAASKMRKPITAEQVEMFRESLFAQLNGEWLTSLGVDYGPDMPLVRALDAAGIPETFALPIKTHTSVDHSDGKISARLGYGGKWQTIWPNPDAPTLPNPRQHGRIET